MDAVVFLESVSSAAGIPVRNNALRLPCPAHNGSNPTSLQLAISPDGSTLLVHCHSHGCSFENILRALEALYGVQLLAHRPAPSQATERRYVYRKPGSPDLTQVELRYDGPCNRPGCRAKQAHKHCWREPRGLPSAGYLLMLHQPAQPVPDAPPVVAEGEKTAQAVADAGYPAYSYIGGTAGAGKADYSPLRGQPLVLVAPDNDQPGAKAAQASAACLLAQDVMEVRILPVSELPRGRGADLADVDLERRREILGRLAEAPPPEPGPNAGMYLSHGAPYKPLDSTPFAASLRFLSAHGDSLMIAYDSDGLADVYMSTLSGIWRHEWSGMSKLLSLEAKRWLARGAELLAVNEIDRRDFLAATSHAARLQAERGWQEVWATCGAALRELEDRDAVPDGITVCSVNDLDRDLRYIGAPNGVIDLDTGALLTGAEARACLVTRSVPDPYVPGASHPVADSLFAHIEPGEREWLLDAFAFSLRGLPSRRVYILEGPPGGGKTTALNAIRGCLGDAESGGYGFSLSHTALVADRFSSANSHSEHLAYFPVGRVATASDLPDRRLDTGLLKSLSGTDAMPMRRLGRSNPASRMCTATLFISLNDGNLHNIDLGDSGLAARVRLLRYPALQVEADMEIVSQVATSSGIRQAVFAELVRRAAVLRRPPEDIPTVARATLEAKEESLGDVGIFAARVVAGGMDAWLSTDELWEAALEASCAQDSMPWGLDRNRLMRRVSRIRGMHPAKGRKVGSRVVRGWAGFRLDDSDSVLGC